MGWLQLQKTGKHFHVTLCGFELTGQLKLIINETMLLSWIETRPGPTEKGGDTLPDTGDSIMSPDFWISLNFLKMTLSLLTQKGQRGQRVRLEGEV